MFGIGAVIRFITIFIFLRRNTHHNIYPISDPLLTSWYSVLFVCEVFSNFLIKYRDIYLWCNIKYIAPEQRAISLKDYNSPFFSGFSSLLCGVISARRSRSVLPRYILRSIIGIDWNSFWYVKSRAFPGWRPLQTNSSKIKYWLNQLAFSQFTQTHKICCLCIVQPFIRKGIPPLTFRKQ